MLIAVVVCIAGMATMTAIALLGWSTALRLSRRAETAEALARYANERQDALETASQRIRLNEASPRREVADALERASVAAAEAAELRLKLSLIRADLEAERSQAADDADEFYDSTTRRLRKFPSLAAKSDV